jgi:hypothetical protein
MGNLVKTMKAKGGHAHRGTQRPLADKPKAASMSNSAGPSSSPASFNIMSISTSSSSKHKAPESPFDFSGQSSSSLKRTKVSENGIMMRKLVNTVSHFSEKLGATFSGPASASASAPEPEPAVVERGKDAVRRLIAMKGDWLSGDDTVKTISIFEKNPSKVDYFLTIEDTGDVEIIRKWVLKMLRDADL